jgi:hypothetical protein
VKLFELAEKVCQTFSLDAWQSSTGHRNGNSTITVAIFIIKISISDISFD